MSTYPGTLDSFTNPSGTNTLDSPDHALQHTDINDAVEAIETKVGVGSGTPVVSKVLYGTGNGTSSWESTVSGLTVNNSTFGTPSITGGTINNPTIAVGSDATGDLYYRSSGTVVSRLAIGTANQFLTTNGTTPSWTYTSMSDGWTKSSHTWVYASASTFTVASTDVTAIYQKGTRLRFKQGGGYKYAVVVASSFSTNTTVTIAVNTNYTIANSSITDNDFSYQMSPQGYPDWFDWTPAWVGYSADPTVSFAKFRVDGKICHFKLMCSANGTSGGANSTRNEISLPVTIARNLASSILGYGVDNGSIQNELMGAFYNGSGTTLQLSKTNSQTFTSWTGSGNKSANVEGSYEI